MDELILEQEAPNFGTRFIISEGIVSKGDVRVKSEFGKMGFVCVLDRGQVKELREWIDGWLSAGIQEKKDGKED